jgi:hypothetical protein
MPPLESCIQQCPVLSIFEVLEVSQTGRNLSYSIDIYSGVSQLISPESWHFQEKNFLQCEIDKKIKTYVI